ncbi:sensor histidine kinase [Clostridium tertium]|uniref:sensor histidine kinase n=1 Tax=Clostridium tertium TaxID=1559 RepID=UPI0024B33C8D|nr:sensor histidine kinase [Clostridium tertium]MDI9215654.1 sensor histidine kinase [Clostridium tertium]
MRKSKELLLIRYISFIILIAQIFIEEKNTSIYSIMFILLFIINNNLRVFYFRNDKLTIFSMMVEIIISPIAYLNFGGSILFYLIGITIDVLTLKFEKIKYIFLIVISLISLSSKFNKNIEDGFINLVIMFIFIILLNYISRLYNTKKEAQRLYDKLRISEEQLIETKNHLEECLTSIEELTVIKERNRISREIHDSVGHSLSTAMIQLSAMESIADKEGSMLKDMAGNLRNFINESFQDVKKAVSELKSDDYDNYRGLIRIQELCKNFEKMSGVEVNIILSKGDWTLSIKQSTHLYRITQEVLSNALRHGKASKVKVIMNFTENDFVISFKDDGIGTDIIKESGFGLKNIRERAEEIDGIIDVSSEVGKGFFIKLVIPRDKEN